MSLRFDANEGIEMTNLNQPQPELTKQLSHLHARTRETKRYIQCQLFFVVLIVLVFGIVVGIYSKEIKDDIDIIQNAVAGVPNIEKKVETLLSTTVPHIDAQVELLLNKKVPLMMQNIDQLLSQAGDTLTAVQIIQSKIENPTP